MDRGEGAPDVFVERIVEGDSRREPSHLSIRDGLQRAGALDQDVLDHLDRRPEADAAGRLGQGAQQVQQNVEMRRQEGIEVGERLAVEVGVIELGVGQLGVAGAEPARGGRTARRVSPRRLRFAQQPAIADLLDVAGFQRDRDREAVLELV